ncbi:MAG: DUF1080 domain-containing protein [Cyclobacteriaceae bacterium]|nr:DUF1080 domain-containing protein [Cyclobacteriaceae bacterium]
MKQISVAFVVAFLVWNCGTKQTETVNNQLTDQQKADGWKLLFNGQNNDGWRAFKNNENDSWEVVDGTLHCKATAEKRSDIMTADQYTNFELAFDWKISAKGNSGVMFRVTEEFDVPFATGPEYQVIDDKDYPGELKPAQLSGANYDMHPAGEKKLNPAGEWNSARLIVNGNHVEHWLNGAKVVEYELSSDDWKSLVAASKWKDFPGYGLAPKGHIDFQDHGNEVWYRNIMIKEL